jgi:hypothetical protein
MANMADEYWRTIERMRSEGKLSTGGKLDMNKSLLHSHPQPPKPDMLLHHKSDEAKLEREWARTSWAEQYADALVADAEDEW